MEGLHPDRTHPVRALEWSLNFFSWIVWSWDTYVLSTCLVNSLTGERPVLTGARLNFDVK